VIEKKYQANNRNLVHIDAYRLLSVFDLEAVGFRESIEDKNNLVVVEWPEKVFSEFPEKMKIINFSYLDENTRKITF
jgi:tRNA threonylcarbamoyladenosine biosynthesis protein TsaE